ncbi:MAG: hypothetical protein IPQ10_00070 [Saprospiraceae bacterium]|nr:hypothetical protein [Saprospiraceae bacterium]
MQILVWIKINFPVLQMGHKLMSIPVLINMHKELVLQLSALVAANQLIIQVCYTQLFSSV